MPWTCGTWIHRTPVCSPDPLPSGPHRVISFSTSRGHYIFHPLHEPWVNADVPSGWWCSHTYHTLTNSSFPISACSLMSFSQSWMPPSSPCWSGKKISMSDRKSSTLWKCLIFPANSALLFIYGDISPLTKIHLVFQDKWKGFRGVNLETYSKSRTAQALPWDPLCTVHLFLQRLVPTIFPCNFFPVGGFL